jgi:integrase
MAVKVRERPKGSGTWWIFIDHQGKRKAKRIGNDKKLAHEVARKVEAKLTLGDLDISQEKPHPPLFKDYAESWLNGSVKSLRRQSTFERYQDVLKRRIDPTLGNRPIDEISRGEVRDLLLKLNRKGLSRSSICLIRDVIGGPLSFAADEELIPLNPASGITKKLQLRRDKKIEIEPLNTEEVRVLLDSCPNPCIGSLPLLPVRLQNWNASGGTTGAAMGGCGLAWEIYPGEPVIQTWQNDPHQNRQNSAGGYVRPFD